MVWRLNSDYRVTYINPSDERLRGYNPDEVIGKHFLDFFEESALPAVKKIVQQRREDIQRGIRVGTLRFEEQHRCKDGRLLWAEINSTPEYDNYGILTGFYGISRDVTERKLAEKTLQDRNKELGCLYSIIGYSGRSRPGFRRDADRQSDLMATSNPVGSRPLFRCKPTGCL